MKRTKHILTSLTAVATITVVIQIAGAAVTSSESTDWIQKTSEGRPTFDLVPEGLQTVAFRAQSGPQPPRAAHAGLVANIGTDEDAFIGDYTAAGIKGLSFRITRGGAATTGVTLSFIGASGRQWSSENVAVNSSDSPGTWVINNIPLDREAGKWRWYGYGLNLDAAWTEDLRNIQEVSIGFSKSGLGAQTVSVDDFRLIGDGFVSEAAVLRRLRDHFGDISNTDQLTGQQTAQDSDKDGVTDLNALLDGQEPGLAVDIVEVSQDGITVKWPAVKGRNYDLVRCSDLTEGFTRVVMNDRPSEESGWMEYKDSSATESVPYYYRVIKK